MKRFNTVQTLRNLSRQPLFWLGLAVKVALCVTVLPELMETLFLPFLTDAAQHGWKFAYSTHLDAQRVESFPYPLVMLAAFALPLKLALAFGFQSPMALAVVMRLVLLLADTVLLLVLANWLRRLPLRRLLVFYWLSPALIYISYIHGQLDALPITLLAVSLYFLFREKMVASGILLALAICAKTHVALILPFYAVYLWKNKTAKRGVFQFFGIVTALVAAIMAKGMESAAFTQMVLGNSTQAKALALAVPFGEEVRYLLLPAVYLLILLASLRYVRFSRDLYISLVTFTFAVVTLFVPPMPGWYYWFLPFMAYTLLKQDVKRLPFFMVLQVLFLLYAEYDGAATWLSLPDTARDLVFTALQTVLLAHIYLLYRQGLAVSQVNFSGFHKPYLLGIGGNSGTGKTTLTDGLEKVLGRKNMATICGDGMHKWERGDENWHKHTHLDPKANHLHNDYFNLRSLKSGVMIKRRRYDHETGQFTRTQKLTPKPVIVYEGLHAFYLESMRSIADLKVFLKPDEGLAQDWKVERDAQKRGHSREKVLEQLAAREPDRARFIEVQEKYADIVFTVMDDCALKVLCSNTIYAERIAYFWSEKLGLEVDHRYLDDNHQQILVKGDVSDKLLNRKTESLLPHLRDVLYPHLPSWPSGMAGLMCQMIAYVMFYEESTDAKYD